MIPLIVALVPFDRSSMEPSHRSTATALISRRQQLPHRGTITYDLHFGGVAMLFSWSSCGTLQGYLTDETNVRWAQNDFPEFLRLSLSQLGLTTVHAVAHSMGNRVLAEILGAAASLRKTTLGRGLIRSSSPRRTSTRHHRWFPPGAAGSLLAIWIALVTIERMLNEAVWILLPRLQLSIPSLQTSTFKHATGRLELHEPQ
jgi:alpha/beta hydrolase family protein DUF900